MTFNDIFKSGFLENVTSVSILDMAVTLVLAFALGLFIFMVYKKTYSGVMYSASFGVTLIAMTMLTGMIILAVSSNVVLSLGMVGALSIVRFRAAIKEPMDIAFIFWAIGAGIVLAAGMIPLAVFGSIATGVTLIIFVNRKPHSMPYILVIQCSNHEIEKNVTEFLKSKLSRCVVKSKSVRKGSIELHLEVRMKDENTDFVDMISDMEGINSAVLVSYNGDYMR